MNTRPKKYWMVLTGAIAGLVLVCIGLWLASRSNPSLYPLDVKYDAYIGYYSASGFVCTIVGLGMLLMAVKNTTNSMPPQNKTNANIGMGFGLLLQAGGLLFPGSEEVRVAGALVLILASLPLFIWGAMNYAQGKGHSKWLGWAGAAGVVGLIVLMMLPDRKHREGTFKSLEENAAICE